MHVYKRVRRSICSKCPCHLHFAVQLVACGSRHENVHDGKVVVDGRNYEGVAGPDDASGKDGDLLVGRYFFSGLFQVANV